MDFQIYTDMSQLKVQKKCLYVVITVKGYLHIRGEWNPRNQSPIVLFPQFAYFFLHIVEFLSVSQQVLAQSIIHKVTLSQRHSFTTH